MKNRLLHFSLFAALTAVGGCTKSNPPDPLPPVQSNYPALNSVEQQLIGRWMIVEETDTTFEFDAAGAVVEASPADPRYNSDTAFNYHFMGEENELGRSGYDYARSSYDATRVIPGSRTFGWLYDEGIARLLVRSEESYEILKLTGSELYMLWKIKSAGPGSGTTETRHYERFTRL